MERCSGRRDGKARPAMVVAAATLLVAQGAVAAGPIEEVVVTGHPLSAEGLASASRVLSGEALARSLRGSIGATVENVPGIHSASFGQAVGRPVIHGLSGARVRVMEDRIDTLDASVTSGDHAVTVEPFIADRVEILKGPATLLYGAGAIGGVVDVHTGRIAHRLPDQPIAARFEARGDSATDGRTVAGRVDATLGTVVLHADAHTRRSEDYDVPGFVVSAAERARDPDALDRGRVRNSFVDGEGYSGGLTWVGDRGFIGASVSRLESDYGLPGGHAHEEHEGGQGEDGEEGEGEGGHDDEGHEEEGFPTLDLRQTRIDVEAALEDPLPGIAAFNVRFARNDYEHAEIEGSGEFGTVFDNRAWELRSEVTHETLAGMDGAFGVQFGHRDFSALGEEAFVPPVRTNSMAAFVLEQFDEGDLQFEAGARWEHTRHETATAFGNRSFDTGAVSLGVIYPLQQWTVAATLDWAMRPPSVEELFSDGPHLAARSFEVGDPDLDAERVVHGGVTVSWDGERGRVQATGYWMRFDGFLFQRADGTEEDGLPVLVWNAADADVLGVDIEVDWGLAQWPGGELRGRLFGDVVSGQARGADDDDLPRIPPLRVGLGLTATLTDLRLDVDWQRRRAQRDIAPFEDATGGFHDLTARAAWSFSGFGGARGELFVTGRNLTDAKQRDHTSLLQAFAPRPGRSVDAGVRLAL